MESPRSSKSKSSIRSSKEKKLKKSGVRTKFLIESLRNEYYDLREENDRLRQLVSTNLPQQEAQAILSQCFDPNNAPKAKAENLDELADKMAGAGVSEDEDEDDIVGFWVKNWSHILPILSHLTNNSYKHLLLAMLIFKQRIYSNKWFSLCVVYHFLQISISYVILLSYEKGSLSSGPAFTSLCCLALLPFSILPLLIDVQSKVLIMF